jgi:hypothetical protein
MFKQMKMRWAGHAARLRKRGRYAGYGWESLKEGDHYKDQDIGGRIILK